MQRRTSIRFGAREQGSKEGRRRVYRGRAEENGGFRMRVEERLRERGMRVGRRHLTTLTAGFNGTPRRLDQLICFASILREREMRIGTNQRAIPENRKKLQKGRMWQSRERRRWRERRPGERHGVSRYRSEPPEPVKALLRQLHVGGCRIFRRGAQAVAIHSIYVIDTSAHVSIS